MVTEMANNSKRSSNRAGAVLITVLTVACFAAILLTAVLTFVKRAHTNAYNNYNSEQAYYIASSALGSVHEYFEGQKDQNYPDLVAYAEANTNGTITLGNSAIGSVIPGGDCKVNISKVNDGYIRLSVTGYYNGQAETINAYYTVTPGQKASGIDNALYSNGAANFEHTCKNTGSITTGNSYITSNNPSSSGSVITGGDFMIKTQYTWKSDPNGEASSYVVVQGSMFADNQNAQFIPSNSKKNPMSGTYDNSSLFIALGRAYFGGNNLIIGDQTADLEMDMYCNTAFIGAPAASDYYRQKYYASEGFANTGAILTMCGNLYCYKIEDPSSDDYNNAQDGDLIVTSDVAGADIEGDVFVEGNIIFRTNNKGFKIKKINSGDPNSGGGTLYVSPTTEIRSDVGPLNAGSKIVCDAVSGDGLTYARVAQWMADGVLEINGVNTSTVVQEYNSNKTNPNLESILQMAFGTDKVRTDPINHGSANSRNYKPSVQFDPNYIKNYETTQEFLDKTPDNVNLKANYEAASLVDMEVYKQAAKYHDDELNLDFDYYINGSQDSGGCYIDDPTRFQNGGYVFVDMNAINDDYVIRIKGTSSTTIMMPTFIVKNGTRNEDGSWISAAKHCLYIIAEDQAEDMTVFFSSTGIFDYYTYKYVIKEGRAVNTAGYGKNGMGVVEKNASPGDADFPDGIFTPERTRTFLMVNPGDNVILNNANNGGSFIEAVIYAPQANFTWRSYGRQNVKFLTNINSYETAPLPDNSPLAVLGAIICDQMQAQQGFGVSFIPPSTDTNLGGNGGSENVDSVTFSHYESR